MKVNSSESTPLYSFPENVSPFDRRERFQRTEVGEKSKKDVGEVEQSLDEKCLMPGREAEGGGRLQDVAPSSPAERGWRES